jgi:transposase-like protein
MKRRPEKRTAAQVPPAVEALRQLLLPMVGAAHRVKAELALWIQEVGLAALKEVFQSEAELLAGPKGKHRPDRTRHRWGTASSELTMGGRRVVVPRPRVRSKAGREVPLPSLEHFQSRDAMSARVVDQILLGVSTRGYEASLGPVTLDVKTRGTSRSAVSRRFVAASRAKAHEHLTRRLDGLTVVALLIDGIEVKRHTVIVGLAVTTGGEKVPVGLWQGSTENAAVCTSLLQDLIGRGFRFQERLLCVIDGSKALRKAITDVLGDAAIVQRCQVHKLRNLKAHLPKERHGYVVSTMREAYRASTADLARKRLRALAAWLERNECPQAATSLREGLEETLTVLKLGLSGALRRTFATTNAIENLLGGVRRVTRNVKHWGGGQMVSRWTITALLAAQKNFRRVRGCNDMRVLLDVLKRAPLDSSEEAA